MKFKINQSFAANYDERRRKEELSKRKFLLKLVLSVPGMYELLNIIASHNGNTCFNLCATKRESILEQIFNHVA